VGWSLTWSVAVTTRDEAGVTSLRMVNKSKLLSARLSVRDSARQCPDARVIYVTSSVGLPPLFARLM
jgi:hypothetical protein